MKYWVREVDEYSGTTLPTKSFDNLTEADEYVAANSKDGILLTNYWFMDVVNEADKNTYLGINQSDKRTRRLK